MIGRLSPRSPARQRITPPQSPTSSPHEGPRHPHGLRRMWRHILRTGTLHGPPECRVDPMAGLIHSCATARLRACLRSAEPDARDRSLLGLPWASRARLRDACRDDTGGVAEEPLYPTSFVGYRKVRVIESAISSAGKLRVRCDDERDRKGGMAGRTSALPLRGHPERLRVRMLPGGPWRGSARSTDASDP